MPIRPFRGSPNTMSVPARFLLLLVLSVSLIALLPRPSHATPFEGDYVFTSGLTGTFTSDGTQLTAWNILGNFGMTYIGNAPSDGGQSPWQFSDGVIGTDPVTHTIPTTFLLLFYYFPTGVLPSNVIQYHEEWGNNVTNSQPRTGNATFERVPEPSSVLLAGLGLLLLLGYGWKQRHQIGL